MKRRIELFGNFGPQPKQVLVAASFSFWDLVRANALMVLPRNNLLEEYRWKGGLVIRILPRRFRPAGCGQTRDEPLFVGFCASCAARLFLY
jgi:hypothetical protein